MAQEKRLEKDLEAKPTQWQRLRHDLGVGFVAALDSIRQQVVEEGWSGQTQTTSHQLQSQFDDPLASLYGNRSEPVSGISDSFRDQCRETFEARGPESAGGEHGIDR